jgi:toxin ParE1/3/4
MRVRLSETALADIRDIAEFVAANDPVRAAAFADELLDACEQIGDQPRAYPRRTHWGPRIRVRFFGHYAIIFLLRADSVGVLRIVHGSRDLDRLMEGEPKDE